MDPKDGKERELAQDLSILIADDEPSLLDLYTTFLQDDFDLITTADGEEALEKVNDEIDMIILDRQMPKMGGDETAKELRKQGYTAPILIITGEQPDTDIINLPCDDYITKPVGKSELIAKVIVHKKREKVDTVTREFFELASKKVALEKEGDSSTTTKQEYQDLLLEMKQKKDQISGGFDELLQLDPILSSDDLDFDPTPSPNAP